MGAADDVAEAEGEQRITTYIIITPGDREIEEIDSSATYPYDERYDFDDCFPRDEDGVYPLSIVVVRERLSRMATALVVPNSQEESCF